MSNHLTILERSAIPEKIKRNSHTQEIIRSLRNTSRELEWKTKAEIISQFSHSLMCSGYSERYREEVITSGMKGFDKQLERSVKGEVPLHRPREFNKNARNQSINCSFHEFQ